LREVVDDDLAIREAALASAVAKSAQPAYAIGGFPVTQNSCTRCGSIDGELVHISGAMIDRIDALIELDHRSNTREAI
jgi:hypothetical protein